MSFLLIINHVNFYEFRIDCFGKLLDGLSFVLCLKCVVEYLEIIGGV